MLMPKVPLAKACICLALLALSLPRECLFKKAVSSDRSASAMFSGALNDLSNSLDVLINTLEKHC
jgi:hypothetical protein